MKRQGWPQQTKMPPSQKTLCGKTIHPSCTTCCSCRATFGLGFDASALLAWRGALLLNRWRRWRVDKAFFSTLSVSVPPSNAVCVHACVYTSGGGGGCGGQGERVGGCWLEGERVRPSSGAGKTFFSKGVACIAMLLKIYIIP